MSFHAAQLARVHLAPFQQHPAFGATLSHLGRPPLRVALPDTRRDILLMRRRFGPVTLGLVSRADISRADLRSIRDASGCRFLIVNSETSGRHPGVLLHTGAHVAELDLRRSAAAIKSALAQKWRNRLNRASAAGLEVTHTVLPDDPEHRLLSMDQAQQRLKGYRGYPAAFTAAFAAANPGQARLFEAWSNGEPVAAMLFLCHGAVATYHIGWNGKQGRAVSAHHLLLWHAILGLAPRGIARLDLGLVDTETAPGLARFKLGSGATCRPLGGTWGILR